VSQRGARGSLLVPVLLIVGGGALLLQKLGVLKPIVWQSLLPYWPCLLILLGVDLIARRVSFPQALATLLAACLLIGAGMAAFHILAPSEWVTRIQRIEQPLEDVSSARIALSCNGCALHVTAGASPRVLVEGSVALRADERLSQTITRNDPMLQYRLQSAQRFRFPWVADRSTDVWTLSLTSAIPLTLSVRGAASYVVDAHSLGATVLDLASTETGTLTLPSAGSVVAYLSGGTVRLWVPEGLALQIEGDDLDRVVTPDTYIRADTSIVSPDWDSADRRARVLLLPGVDGVEVALSPPAP
jgi:hypothetical protein